MGVGKLLIEGCACGKGFNMMPFEFLDGCLRHKASLDQIQYCHDVIDCNGTLDLSHSLLLSCLARKYFSFNLICYVTKSLTTHGFNL